MNIDYEYRPRVGQLCSFEAIPAIFSAIGSMGPALGAVSSGVGLFEKLFGGGGGGGGGSQGGAASIPKQQAASTITGTPVAPGTSPGDFTKSQEAYWQQLMS